MMLCMVMKIRSSFYLTELERCVCERGRRGGAKGRKESKCVCMFVCAREGEGEGKEKEKRGVGSLGCISGVLKYSKSGLG